ncbi:MAG: ROK family transcriptional regulator [Bryobacteraceae bacterium]
MLSRVTHQRPSQSIRTATPSSVREVNRAIMLDLIRRRQPISRADLARITGVFRSSVSDIVDELLDQKLVLEERHLQQRGRGRVPMNLRLNDENCRVMGLNIRPSYSQIGCSGLSGVIQQSLYFPTPSSPKKLIAAISQAASKLCKAGAHTFDRYERVGIAVPGHVDARTGEILWTPTHPELNHFPVTRAIEDALGIPALADNDCNLGALSELWLSNRDGNADFIFLNLSDYGVGAGVVINGEIYLGHDSRFAAEVGHMIVESDGLPCRCGRNGCWEMYVSNDATYKRLEPASTFSEEAFEKMLSSARRGNKRACRALEETVHYLSVGVSNIRYLFNPSEIVVAGRITEVWNLIQQTLTRQCSGSRALPKLRPARMSADDSLLHGAVCLALRATFAGPKFG